MYVKKYKRINNVNFALTNSAIIYSNDLFVNQDLIELIELVVKGKNPDPQAIKFEECDIIGTNKDTKIITIPSLFDLRKNAISGTKALLSLLVKEIVFNSKFKNENLNLLQNLLTGFDFTTEFSQIETLQKEIQELTGIELELTLDEVIEKYFAENFLVSFSKNEITLKEDEISLLNSRLIYFKILELLAAYWDDNILVIFENPYLGLNYQDVQILEPIINQFTNKVLILNTMNPLVKKQLNNLTMLLDRTSLNFPTIIDDWQRYQFYLSKEYDPLEFLLQFTLKMQNSVNWYGEEWINYESLNHDEKLFWDNVTNQINF